MTLFILDPNLDRESGHHLDWDLGFARAAMERGEAAVIYAHRDFGAGERDGVTIRPWFTHTTYGRNSTDPISGAFDDFCHFNDILAADLARLPPGLLKASDAVVVPTLNEQHLLGYVSWMKGFEPSHAPLFIVHLMFPSGLLVATPGSTPIPADPMRALFYRLAFRRAEEPGARIHFYGGGRQLAREYSAMLGREIEPHPIPLCPERRAARSSGGRPVCLLFSGDAKLDKGITLAAELAAAICEAHPEWDFLVHASAAVAWGDAKVACNRLVALGQALPNLEVRTERLSGLEYYALMERADMMLFTYDPVAYARKSSGALWESVSLGIPVLVPANCWLEREALEWSTGVMSYAGRDVRGILDHFAAFSAALKALSATAAAAATRYRAQNGPVALMDQIGQLWGARFLAARLASVPEARDLPIAAQAGLGWSFVEEFKGRPVRWIDQETDIAFAWPFAMAWQLDLQIVQFRGADQVSQATASIGATRLRVQHVINPDGTARLVITPPLPYQRRGGDTVVRLTLPWAWRPEGETRGLGLLVNRLVLSPPAGTAMADQRIELLSPATLNAEGNAFLLKGCMTGAAILDCRHDAPVSFELFGVAAPEDARAVRLFVNGVAVPLDMMATGEASWRVGGICPPAVLQGGGLRSEWDLTLDGDVLDDVWISRFTLGGQRLLAGPQSGPPAPPPPIVSPDSRAGRGKAVQPSGQDVGKGSPAPDAQLAHLDELMQTDGHYQHLDLSIYRLAFEDETWDHVKLKICRDGEQRHLEFRRISGWPEMFALWPGEEADSYGELLRLSLDAPLPPLPNRRDRDLLRGLAAKLEAAVRTAMREAGRERTEMTAWTGEAALHARSLEAGLRRFE